VKQLDLIPFRTKKAVRRKQQFIREKGGEWRREMAYSLGWQDFEGEGAHMTISSLAEKNLEDVAAIVFVGGFSYSDVLGPPIRLGQAQSFIIRKQSKRWDNFYARERLPLSGRLVTGVSWGWIGS